VNLEAQQEEQALRSQLDRTRSTLDGLVRELDAVDVEIEEHSTERQQFDLLHEACSALEKLSELGGANLFWGEGANERSGDLKISEARLRMDTFSQRLSEVESRRRSILERIQSAQDETDYLEEDLFELKQQEEMRKLEWVVERAATPDRPSDETVMPWSRGGEDDRRFRKSLIATLLASLLLAILVPMIDLPVRESWEVVEIPDRLTRLIEEERPLPPVPQQTRPEEKKIETQQEEAPVLAEESTPEPTPKPTPKQSAGSKGILAFREKFSELAESTPSARLGAQARIDRTGEAAVGRQGRSLVATQATGSSGGIDIAALSRDVVGGGGVAIEGVEVGKAASSIGGLEGDARPLSGGPGPSRTDEEIQIVFDRHKAALYRLYNRELRRDPTLQGQIVLRLTIEPDGSVSLCELQSSDMDAPKLSSQVVGRVKTFDFGPKEGVTAVTILYPIDFLPAS